MIRVIVQQLLLFALPFIGYFLYRALASRGQGFLSDTPWLILTITGLVFGLLAMLSLGIMEQGQPGGVYVPPRVEDGQIIPGHVDPPAQ